MYIYEGCSKYSQGLYQKLDKISHKYDNFSPSIYQLMIPLTLSTIAAFIKYPHFVWLQISIFSTLIMVGAYFFVLQFIKNENDTLKDLNSLLNEEDAKSLQRTYQLKEHKKYSYRDLLMIDKDKNLCSKKVRKVLEKRG